MSRRTPTTPMTTAMKRARRFIPGELLRGAPRAVHARREDALGPWDSGDLGEVLAGEVLAPLGHHLDEIEALFGPRREHEGLSAVRAPRVDEPHAAEGPELACLGERLQRLARRRL